MADASALARLRPHLRAPVGLLASHGFRVDQLAPESHQAALCDRFRVAIPHCGTAIHGGPASCPPPPRAPSRADAPRRAQ
jgi:hypothetical protein